jgi:DNA processing protein
MNSGFISKSELPSLLANLSDSPDGIYYKGEFSMEMFDRCLAVVGSRRNTRYTGEVLESLLGGLVANGVTIVSGFMYGVDAEAHLNCIELGGRTIAVLPYGIDFEPPGEMAELYNSILENKGLFISEYPGNHPPEKWTFIARNRIVAGLSQAVLVVEAAKKSGALITAKKALEYGREVFAVPGSIVSGVSVGTNNLIKEGARLVSNCADILDVFGWGSGFESGFEFSNSLSSIRLSNLDEKESKLFEVLTRNPGSSYDELFEFSNYAGFQEDKLIAVLTRLQISGYVIEDGGRFYVNKG